jgi:hypothetical protein
MHADSERADTTPDAFRRDTSRRERRVRDGRCMRASRTDTGRAYDAARCCARNLHEVAYTLIHEDHHHGDTQEDVE